MYGELKNIREENHREYTEFKGHINEILLEYKDSILIIQSYVDNQLIVSRRDRVDINLLLDKLMKKTKFYDELSKNFHQAMDDIKGMVSSLAEVMNINYHLQTQDEKDRESIALMGINQNTNHVDYKKNSEVPPITIDKN